jgi:hypothetical protein
MDWPEFLSRNHVDYVERGRNVSRGNIAINCPFCAGADPSQHLNISLSGKGFYCLRNRAHSGGEARLVQRLLNCSYEQALAVVRSGRALPDDWYSRVKSLLFDSSTPVPADKPLEWPEEFRRLDHQRLTVRPYWNYLHSRGYTDQQIDRLWEDYDVAYCNRGPFHGRIMFPVYFDHRLVTWTGRAISPTKTLRYKTLTADADKALEAGTPCALGPISSYLLWWDHLLEADADTIMLCEGPFDALRLMHLGKSKGVVATCFFTAQPGPQQIDLLHELLPRFQRKLLLLDAGTWATGMRVTDSLAALGVQRLDLPSAFNDPGTLSIDVFARLLRYPQGNGD